MSFVINQILSLQPGIIEILKVFKYLVIMLIYFNDFPLVLVKVVNSCVRWASKKAGGSSRNRKGHACGKRRGIKESDGSYVTQSSILVRQLGVRFHPGLNVSISVFLTGKIHLIV